MQDEPRELPAPIPLQERRGLSPRVTRSAPKTPSKRRRFRYRRKHTPHYYIVLTAITLAILVCVLEALAFAQKSLILSEVSFFAVAITTLFVSGAFFWGFYMAMSGNIPSHRLKYFVPHGAVGVLSPLFYTLNISLGLDGFGRQRVGIWSLVCSVVCLLLLLVQFSMGKAVVHREPLRVVRKAG
jgi:uncharacterized membrane protein